MEKVLHRNHTRGKGEHGWLSTRYSFSFADWYEPKRMGFGKLRVINDDLIAPASGFGAHGHKDMEIVTLVTEGTLTHKDSLGNTGTIPAGDVQAMSAGTGVVHAEYNDSADEPLALFQIWIETDQPNATPRYAQQSVGFSDEPGLTTLIVPEGSDEDGLPIHQDAYVHRVVLDAEHPYEYQLRNPEHGVYIFVIDGDVQVTGEELGKRDAIGVWGVDSIELSSTEAASLLLFEVSLH